jgi:hypothetical protein
MKSALLTTVALGALCFGGAVQAASMHTRVFTSSGTFTIPSDAKPAQEFLFTVVGGGGGGGGCGSDEVFVASGGAGANGFASFSGFSASDTVTITVGAGGSAGGSASNGGNGGTSKATYSSTDIVGATGGTGSHTDSIVPGAAGAFSATAGSTGLTLQASLNYGAQDGGTSVFSDEASGTAWLPGGSNAFGSVGTPTHLAGTTGGAGAIIVTWVQ